MHDRTDNQTPELLGDEQMYMDEILEHSKRPHNAGTLPDATFMHREVNTSCGDTVEMYVRLKDGRVDDVKFDGHGCAISQASVSMLTDHVKGMPVEQVKALTQDEVLGLLGIKVGMTRLRCALLGMKTLEVGLEKHRSGIDHPVSSI